MKNKNQENKSQLFLHGVGLISKQKLKVYIELRDKEIAQEFNDLNEVVKEMGK